MNKEKIRIEIKKFLQTWKKFLPWLQWLYIIVLISAVTYALLSNHKYIALVFFWIISYLILHGFRCNEK